MVSCSEQFLSFMKFCSAVLEDVGLEIGRDRRTDGRTDEGTDGHKDHYIPPQLRLSDIQHVF